SALCFLLHPPGYVLNPRRELIELRDPLSGLLGIQFAQLGGKRSNALREGIGVASRISLAHETIERCRNSTIQLVDAGGQLLKNCVECNSLSLFADVF